MFRVAVTIRVAGVLLLDVRGIREHERTEVTRARRTEDASLEAVRHEPRQITAVIKVRVREDDRVDVAWLGRERLPVSFAKFLETLKKTAVDKHPVGAGIKKMFGAGDGSGGPKEGQ